MIDPEIRPHYYSDKPAMSVSAFGPSQGCELTDETISFKEKNIDRSEILYHTAQFLKSDYPDKYKMIDK